MALGGCYSCIKYLMFAFNFLFWTLGLLLVARFGKEIRETIVGCALLGLGIWIRVDETFKKYEYFNILYPAAYVMIAVGVAIMVIGFLGCCGAIRESPVMLGCFFLLLFLIFAALFGFGVWCIVEKETVKGKIKEQIMTWVRAYNDDKDAQKTMDNIQRDFRCCGADSRTDYPAGSEPASCLKKDYEEGCSEKFIEWISGKIIIIAVVAISIAVILVLGMIFSMVLCCAVREASV